MRKNGCPQDEVVFSTIISAYGKVGLYDEAEDIFKEIRDVGLLSDVKTYTAMANVLTKAGKYAEALELFEEVLTKDLPMSQFAWNTFLHCCVREGNVPKASGVFRSMQQEGLANIVAYSNMVCLYSRLGQHEELEQIVSQMHAHNVQPDVEFYGTLINYYCESGRMDEAEAAVVEMEMVGILPNQHIKTMLIQAFGKLDRVKDAESVFQSMEKVDAVARGAMCELYRSSGREDEAISVVTGENSDCESQNQLVLKFAKSGMRQCCGWCPPVYRKPSTNCCSENWKPNIQLQQ